MKQLKIKLLSATAKLPTRAHAFDAGLDLRADEDVTVDDRECTLVDTGIAVEIQPGEVGLIMPRSSISKLGVHTYTGVVDSGYTGHVRVGLQCLGRGVHEVRCGDKIAQLLIVPVALCEAVAVDELTAWGTRGTGGWGSSGR